MKLSPKLAVIVVLFVTTIIAISCGESTSRSLLDSSIVPQPSISCGGDECI